MVGNNSKQSAIIDAQALVPENEQHPVSLQITAHDTLCLIGPNSAQLCRYLRALAGVEPPHSGELSLFGRALESMDKKSWREQRQHIGYVAINAPLLSVLRGLDNVMLPALYHKRLSRVEARNKALELIGKIECTGDINQLPAYLTQLQRLQLAIARATILDPAILFVEEPFASLSLAEQQPIYHYFINNRQHQAQVIATHNLKLVRAGATQIVFIGDEQIQHFDNWQQLMGSGDHEVVNYLTLFRQQYSLSQQNG